MSPGMPFDIITSVLCKQPVKTLLRFRCISKQCCFLIDSQDFIKMYQKHPTTNLCIVFPHWYWHGIRRLPRLSTMDFDKLDSLVELNHLLEISYPIIFQGSCNGLFGFVIDSDDFALYNPSTRKFKMLPLEPPPLDCTDVNYGLGYDHINDDYKVVKIMRLRDQYSNEVRVYSLKTDSWKRICSSNLNRYRFTRDRLGVRPEYGVFANGVIHWGTIHSIVAFDLNVDEFVELSLPDDIVDNYVNDELSLGVLEGCLCVICYHNYHYEYFSAEDMVIDMWLMKEYGVKESWTRLFSFKMLGVNLVRPITYSKGRDKILFEVNRNQILWYDLETGRLLSVGVHGGPALTEDGSIPKFTTEICVESLIHLN